MAKYYIVILDSKESEMLHNMINAGTERARRLTHAQIPKANAEFVYRMEDVLDVYKRPEDPRYPLVCLDESPEQLVSETRQSLPAIPGQPERYDYEYHRQGVANTFLFFALLQNWRHIKITARRTKADWAECVRELVDVHFPTAERLVLIQDQLNIRNPACLYEFFPPAEAKRILDRVEFHYTPKHGSWLNMAEIELSVLNRQCFDQQLPDRATLAQESAAWQQSATSRVRQSIGDSQRPMLASSSSASTQQLIIDNLLGTDAQSAINMTEAINPNRAEFPPNAQRRAPRGKDDRSGPDVSHACRYSGFQVPAIFREGSAGISQQACSV